MAGRKSRIISALNARRRQVRRIAKERRDEIARARREILGTSVPHPEDAKER